MQQARDRRAEKTVEVVRNHEGGTGSGEWNRRTEGGFGSWEWTRERHVGGGAPSNESHERRGRRESAPALFRAL
jgi:hypothetical protein